MPVGTTTEKWMKVFFMKVLAIWDVAFNPIDTGFYSLFSDSVFAGNIRENGWMNFQTNLNIWAKETIEKSV